MKIISLTYPITWQPLRDLSKILTENDWPCTNKACQGVVHLYPRSNKDQLGYLILKHWSYKSELIWTSIIPFSGVKEDLPCLIHVLYVYNRRCILLWLTVFLPKANTHPLGSLQTNRNFLHSQKVSKNDSYGPFGKALPLSSRVSLARPVLSCTHYFQVCATQAIVSPLSPHNTCSWSALQVSLLVSFQEVESVSQ